VTGLLVITPVAVEKLIPRAMPALRSGELFPALVTEEAPGTLWAMAGGRACTRKGAGTSTNGCTLVREPESKPPWRELR